LLALPGGLRLPQAQTLLLDVLEKPPRVELDDPLALFPVAPVFDHPTDLELVAAGADDGGGAHRAHLAGQEEDILDRPPGHDGLPEGSGGAPRLSGGVPTPPRRPGGGKRQSEAAPRWRPHPLWYPNTGEGGVLFPRPRRRAMRVLEAKRL